jgi:hypothetical protein
MTPYQIKQKATRTLRKHGVLRASFFGSFAAGISRPDSDLDILVELPDGKTLLDLVALKLDLEDSLGQRVDVVTYESLHPLIRERALSQQVPIV